MLPEDLYFKTLSNEELWQRYCGFLDLRPGEFLDIQRSLLEEHLAVVAQSALGRRILGENPPRTVEEFRASAPLTVYGDYEPELSQRDESSLAAKPAVWCHSSGRGGSFKWVPHSEALMDKTARNCIGLFNLSAASAQGRDHRRAGDADAHDTASGAVYVGDDIRVPAQAPQLPPPAPAGVRRGAALRPAGGRRFRAGTQGGLRRGRSGGEHPGADGPADLRAGLLAGKVESCPRERCGRR